VPAVSVAPTVRFVEGGEVEPYAVEPNVCTFGAWPTMCYADHCVWGTAKGLNDQMALGPMGAMRRFFEVSMLVVRGGLRHMHEEMRYYEYLVKRLHFTVQPLRVAYHLDHTLDERPPVAPPLVVKRRGVRYSSAVGR
jgi:hypothetical protein